MSRSGGPQGVQYLVGLGPDPLSVRFRARGSVPELLQELGDYANSTQAYNTIKATLDACHSFTETVNGTTAAGTLGAMSFPTMGDESTAYTANISAEGSSLAQGFVVVRKGQFVTAVALGDIGSVDTDMLQQFATTAVAKLPAS